MNRDRAPFVLTSDMAYVINGGEKPTIRFQLFVDLCCQAYNLIRKHANLFLNLLSLVSIFINVSWNLVCNVGLLLNPKFFMLQELLTRSFKSKKYQMYIFRKVVCDFFFRLLFLNYLPASWEFKIKNIYILRINILYGIYRILRIHNNKLLCKGDMI